MSMASVAIEGLEAPVTHCNEHLKVKLIEQKYIVWHIATPNATKMNKEVLERQERQRTKVSLFVLKFLKTFLGGEEMLEEWRANKERLENEWNDV